jgi:hypothetical protein
VVRRRLLVIAATAWAALAGLGFAFGPAYSSASETLVEARPDGTVPPPVVRTERASGLDVNGAKILPALLVPVLIAAAPLLVRRGTDPLATTIAIVLLLAFVVLGSFTIGLLYLPSVALLALAALLPDRR